jgi:hypothetical protein
LRARGRAAGGRKGVEVGQAGSMSHGAAFVVPPLGGNGAVRTFQGFPDGLKPALQTRRRIPEGSGRGGGVEKGEDGGWRMED